MFKLLKRATRTANPIQVPKVVSNGLLLGGK
jgi:hypothetical protein